jgi:PEP-CTERM motif
MATIEPTRHRHASICLRMISCFAALCWARPEATAGGLQAPTFSTSATLNADAEAGGLPTPYAYAAASGGFFAASATATATYDFEVVSNNSATGGVAIQITTLVQNEVAGPLTLIYPPSAGYGASASVFLGGETLNTVFAEFDFADSVTGTFLLTSNASVLIGTPYEITVSAVANVAYMDASVSAFADPMITVPAGFSLELSPGIGNVAPATGPPTPEPGSFTLLGIGTVCLGVYGWRRRRQHA